MALNMTLHKASAVPTRATQRRGASNVPAASSCRSRTQIRPQALYIVPRNAAACRPARYYRSPGLGLASGIGLLSSVLGSDWLRESAAVHPVEIATHEDRYELQTDCPGMGQEDITVEISPDRVLTISGVRQTSSTVAAAAAKKSSASPAPATEAAAADTPAASSASTLEDTAAGVGEAGESTSSFSSVTYRFSRSFALPDDADVDSVSASLDKGVLSLSITRRQQPKPQPRRITIN